MVTLLGQHLALVAISSLPAVIAGIGAGVAVTRRGGEEFLSLVKGAAAIAQTFPPAAVLALAVPALGFGTKPAVFALFLFSIFPVLENTIAGIRSVPPAVLDAAAGMGMGPVVRLLRIELPLAFPVILGGVRTAVVINVGTATLGAIVGAGGLGVPIIAGLVRFNPAFVLHGALVAALLAFVLDRSLRSLETRYGREA